MKKIILFGLAIAAPLIGSGQCTITGIGSAVCISDGPVVLSSDAPGGTFTGPGISGDIFDPSVAGLGTHTIDYVAPSVGYTVDQTGTFSPEPAGGTSVSLCDDTYTGDLPIGFTFEFFSTPYTTFQISSNGYIAFGGLTTSGCCSGQTLPNTFNPNNLIACGWEDFNPGCGSAGTIQYQTIGSSPNQVCVVTYTAVPPFGGGTPLTTQIQLYELDNHIEIHTDLQGNSGIHTQGIENASGTEAYYASGRNGASFTLDDDFIAFYPNTGCVTSIDVTVGTAPVVTGTASESEICLGESVTFTSGGDAVSYTWGSIITEGVPYTPTTTGLNTFYVAGTGSDGCVVNTGVDVMVWDIPTTFAPDDFSVCQGEDITLEGAGTATSFVWDNGVSDGVAFTQNVGPVTYTVTGSNDGGCESTDEVVVTVLEAPGGTGTVTHETLGNDGSIDFTATGGSSSTYTYLWSNGATTEDIVALTAGDYTVTVNDGTCSGDVTFTVINQLSVGDNQIDNLSVYPNPVQNFVTIDYANSYSYSIMNAAGQIVMSGQENGKTDISMESLAPGMYVIEIIDGDKISKLSLIKE